GGGGGGGALGSEGRAMGWVLADPHCRIVASRDGTWTRLRLVEPADAGDAAAMKQAARMSLSSSAALATFFSTKRSIMRPSSHHSAQPIIVLRGRGNESPSGAPAATPCLLRERCGCPRQARA